MAETTATKEAVIVDGNVNVIEDMLTNLKLDIEAREEQVKIKEEAAEFISDADSRIRSGRQALKFMTDYMSDEQLKEADELEIFFFDEDEIQERSRLNEVAQSAFDILQKSKTGEMTNGALYENYEKSLKEGEHPVKYGEFNIKLRSLFSNNRLLRIVPEDAENSRTHIIRVNGFKALNK
ncbi:MAG: hypothetical protein NXI10_03465 [bacterium]|nr:hypothetical protein [bacterium]